MRISDWSSDVCSSDLFQPAHSWRAISSRKHCDRTWSCHARQFHENCGHEDNRPGHGMTSLPDPSQPLPRDEAAQAFSALLDGGAYDDAVARFLLALSDRGDTALEIAAASRALAARLNHIRGPVRRSDRKEK